MSVDSWQWSVTSTPPTAPNAQSHSLRVCLRQPARAPFVSRARARYNSTHRTRDLISPECALPSRIVKEQHSFQHSRLSECRVLKAVTQSIDAAEGRSSVTCSLTSDS